MRTPKEIAEYIDYYKGKPKAEREWALKNLEKIEGKSLKELIEYSRRDGIRCRKTLTDDIKEQIKQAVRAGVSNLDIIADFGVSHNTVTRIKNTMRDAGEVLPETRGRRPREEQTAEKQPEAYPGQINDNAPEIEDDVKAYVPGEIRTEPEREKPEIEDDVKAYIPHETEIAGDCKPEPKPGKSLGECMSDIADAFCKMFGVAPTEIEIEPDTESVDFVSVLISLMTFAREQFGEDITLDKISCGKQEEKAEIGFYKNGQLYYLGFYAIAEGEEE